MKPEVNLISLQSHLLCAEARLQQIEVMWKAVLQLSRSIKPLTIKHFALYSNYGKKMFSTVIEATQRCPVKPQYLFLKWKNPTTETRSNGPLTPHLFVFFSFKVKTLSLKWTSDPLEPHQHKDVTWHCACQRLGLQKPYVVSPHGSHSSIALCLSAGCKCV